eukprot:14907238-Heterocapsa_arctica.AAC.1
MTRQLCLKGSAYCIVNHFATASARALAEFYDKEIVRARARLEKKEPETLTERESADDLGDAAGRQLRR